MQVKDASTSFVFVSVVVARVVIGVVLELSFDVRANHVLIFLRGPGFRTLVAVSTLIWRLLSAGSH